VLDKLCPRHAPAEARELVPQLLPPFDTSS